MPSNTFPSDLASKVTRHTVKEEQIEYGFIDKLQSLKYEYRADIRDRAALERNFRDKFEALNRVHLSDGEFKRLLDDIVTPDVFTASRRLRERSAFIRDDGTPLNYTLVNIKDWCKNTFEVINQLRINTDYSHHRYDVLILINGVPCVQVELKTLGINPKRAMEQIVDYKNDPGNGYSKTLLCFLQLFIVSNRTSTYYFANNNTRHFAFNADERFLPIYQFADEANTKINHLDDFADKFLAKCTLGHAISRYMVLVASEQKLLMMRPYQVYAVEDEIDTLNRLVVIFLETAELRTKNRQEIRMAFWQQNVEQIISSNGFTVLTHVGKVSHASMEQQIEPMFKDFEQRRKQQEAARADSQDEAELKALENSLKNRTKK